MTDFERTWTLFGVGVGWGGMLGFLSPWLAITVGVGVLSYLGFVWLVEDERDASD